MNDDLLAGLQKEIKSKISELNYNTWFSQVRAADVRADSLVLTVPNRFIADWIRDYYEDVVIAETHRLTGAQVTLCFEFTPDEQETPSSSSSALPEASSPVRTRTVGSLNPKYSFNRFVVGPSNQFAHAASKSVADLPGGHYNPLFIYGGAGLGKTHLLHAIGLSLAERHPDLNVVFVSTEAFVNEFIVSIRNDRMPAFRRKYRETCGALLMDDVQFIAGKEGSQDELFHTFNALHDLQRQIVLTSDKFPKDIPALEERLRSRFEWGLIADIQPPDLETRVAILQKKAEQGRLILPNDVAMFLAASIKSNVRELEGALIRINAFASLAKTPITVDFAREVLRNIIREQESRLSIESVQKAVAQHFKVGIGDLKSPRRIKTFAHPRQIAMYLCKKHTQTSYPEIGGKFGGKDHTTVMHAVRKIARLVETETSLQHDIELIEKVLLH